MCGWGNWLIFFLHFTHWSMSMYGQPKAFTVNYLVYIIFSPMSCAKEIFWLSLEYAMLPIVFWQQGTHGCQNTWNSTEQRDHCFYTACWQGTRFASQVLAAFLRKLTVALHNSSFDMLWKSLARLNWMFKRTFTFFFF